MNNTDAKNMVAFRNSRKGYDKTDVNRYIEEMSIRFTSKEAQLKSKIKQLEDALASCEGKEADNGELLRLETENSELHAEVERLSALLSEKSEKEESRAEDCICECPEYRDISEKLGGIILKANLDADKIVTEAELEAEKQLSEAEKSADGIRLDAAVSARLMTSKVKEKLSIMTEEYIAGLKSVSEDSVKEYKRLYEELRIKFDQMNSFKKEL